MAPLDLGTNPAIATQWPTQSGALPHLVDLIHHTEGCLGHTLQRRGRGRGGSRVTAAVVTV
jgi:hypothetical protein